MIYSPRPTTWGLLEIQVVCVKFCKELLTEAHGKIAIVSFEKIDLLIVFEIGKNIPETGLDPNVTGVNGDTRATGRSGPDTKRLFVRGETNP